MVRGGGGGRGGGRGGMSMNREQLHSLGVTGNEMLPGPVTQPPPLFPVLGKKPTAFSSSVEQDYILILKQDFIDHMQLSGSYLKMRQSKREEPIQEIDKLVAELPVVKEKYNWKLFPSELRPKMLARRIKKEESKAIDVVEKLAQLEKIEETQNVEKTSNEEQNNQAQDDEDLEVEEDEEMDDGMDYTNNYFDNGEDYEDEDDNLDDGPIF